MRATRRTLQNAVRNGALEVELSTHGLISRPKKAGYFAYDVVIIERISRRSYTKNKLAFTPIDRIIFWLDLFMKNEKCFNRSTSYVYNDSYLATLKD